MRAPESPIDPLAPLLDGVYDDGVVKVRRVDGLTDLRLSTEGRRVVLEHGWAEVDNDLAGLLAAAAVEASVFERLFTGVVLTCAEDPIVAWTRYYWNTLARLTGGDPGSGSIAEFAPIYARARGLVRGHRVLDLASCFGFLPMMLAGDGHEVIASDLNLGSMRLLSIVTARLGATISCAGCGAEALPFPDRSVDTVMVLHLLEHVDADTGSRVLGEAARVARHRVVVAVPYEAEPTAAYGHVRTLDHAELEAMGQLSGLRFEVIDADGGWLVLDH